MIYILEWRIYLLSLNLYLKVTSYDVNFMNIMTLIVKGQSVATTRSQTVAKLYKELGLA